MIFCSHQYDLKLCPLLLIDYWDNYNDEKFIRESPCALFTLFIVLLFVLFPIKTRDKKTPISTFYCCIWLLIQVTSSLKFLLCTPQTRKPDLRGHITEFNILKELYGKRKDTLIAITRNIITVLSCV